MLGLDREFHIKTKQGEIGKYVLLPGSPERAKSISKYFDNPKKVMQNREFVTYTGKINNVRASVCSTGIGGPSASIAMEELCNCGADTFIRVGTCGGINLNVEPGDIIIAQSAVRFEHTSYEYAPKEFPATADFNVTNALFNAAQKLDYKNHVGIVHCKDAFYSQQYRFDKPVAPELKAKWNAWKQLGVLCSEMESAALFTVANFRNARCGTVLECLRNQEREEINLESGIAEESDRAIQVAIEAVKQIIETDKK